MARRRKGRKGRKGRKDAIAALLFPYCAVIPDFHPVIPAKAGIQRFVDAVGTLASAECQRV